MIVRSIYNIGFETQISGKNSYFQGMFVARGKQVLFADADGASQFDHLGKLETEMSKINKNSDNMAVVCGSRAHLEQDSVAQVNFHCNLSLSKMLSQHSAFAAENV